jgi:hypothetical protein
MENQLLMGKVPEKSKVLFWSYQQTSKVWRETIDCDEYKG